MKKILVGLIAISLSFAAPALTCAAAPEPFSLKGLGFYGKVNANTSYYGLGTFKFKLDKQGNLAGQTINLQSAAHIDQAVGFMILFGYDLNTLFDIPFRLECEFVYRFGGGFKASETVDAQLTDASITPMRVWTEFELGHMGSTLINIIYDIPIGNYVKPYILGSAGFGYTNFEYTVGREHLNQEKTDRPNNDGMTYLQYGVGAGVLIGSQTKFGLLGSVRYLRSRQLEDFIAPRTGFKIEMEPTVIDISLGAILRF